MALMHSVDTVVFAKDKLVILLFSDTPVLIMGVAHAKKLTNVDCDEEEDDFHILSVSSDPDNTIYASCNKRQMSMKRSPASVNPTQSQCNFTTIFDICKGNGGYTQGFPLVIYIYIYI